MLLSLCIIEERSTQLFHRGAEVERSRQPLGTYPIIYYITQWGWGEQGHKGDLTVHMQTCTSMPRQSVSRRGLDTDYRGVSVARTAAEAPYWMEALELPTSRTADPGCCHQHARLSIRPPR